MSDLDVYISYSHNDIAVTEALVHCLENLGLKCWYAPRDIAPGGHWSDSVIRAIDEAPYFVLIFSDSSNESDQVCTEVAFVCEITEERHTRINFRVSNVEASGLLRYYVSSNQWIDVDATEDLDQACIDVADQIRDALGMGGVKFSAANCSQTAVDSCCRDSEPECCCSEPSAEHNLELKEVEFSVIAPKMMLKGDYTMIDVVMYEESFRHEVDRIICERESDEPTQESRSGIHKVEDNSRVKIVLHSPDISLDDDTEEGIWRGKHLNFSFAVFLPERYERRQILFNASVYINDVIATRLKFIVKCSSLLEQKIKVTRNDVFSAFMSYASEDRVRVAAIIQGMQKARPDMDIFFDVESLRSGDNWEQALYHEIEIRDILYLCWSRHACESEWVCKEWRYALKNKGEEGVEPVPIDPPDVCPPPKELEYKHFNDKWLYYQGRELNLSKETRDSTMS